METKIIVGILLLVIGVGGAYYFLTQGANNASACNGSTCKLGNGTPGTVNGNTQANTAAKNETSAGPAFVNVQEVSVKALGTGYYDKEEITVKKGIPVKFSFSAEPSAGCGRALYIPDFGVKLVSLNGETQSATFTPTKTGTYAYRCGMNMFHGKLIVID